MTINKELRDRQMTGIGEAGDPMFTIRSAGGQHAVASPAPEPFVKAKRAQSVDDDETWEADRPAPTLSVFDSGDSRATVAIVTPAPAPIAFQSSQSGIRLVETHATLDANNGSRRHNGIIETQPIAFHPTQDPISSVGVTHTMGTGTTGGAATIAVAQAYAVRRLTPTECERLQGFPDGWTAIPFRGKPASDGPRYKAIGNSMAVPVMKWIGERIAIVDKATKGEG
jgi:site-specific DNA-cytosine methylase